MKKIGVVVAAIAALLLAGTQLAFADAQGQDSQHNDQFCGHDSDEESEEDFVLFKLVQDHENDVDCKQDNGDEDDDQDD